MHRFKRLKYIILLLSSIFLINYCKSKSPLFKMISPEYSGVHFNNEIIENDSVNPMEMNNIYNGGGVGIGDFNRDGKPDIYFTGNLVSNKLYLNKGELKFQDITDEAGVTGDGKWCKGVAVVDINNDGWPDIYVCASVKSDPKLRQNLLYINSGNDKNGIPLFKVLAAGYGLTVTTHTTMAAFFDYENEEDLDLSLAVNTIPRGENPGQFRPIHKDGSYPSTCRLYRNDWNDSLKHPVFSDVSRQAGINLEGYSHGVNITDINKDGWKDIYVTNDFLTDNVLYINNHDGSFTDKSPSYFKHTAANAMGQDVEDINNDGLADIIELDMNPEDNYRKKMMVNSNNYHIYQNSDLFGYQYQYVRNTLQLNRGPRVGQNDSVGDPIFSDVGFYSGIAGTDWSWAPLVADFDNDGYRDLIVTNGYPKDVTDHDFRTFLNEAGGLLSKKEILKRIPQGKLHKYAYRNNGDLSFSDVSREWGMTGAAFSNGAVYADLDGDGDLDLVINNINDEAMILRNMSRENSKDDNHYLQLSFAGGSLNRNGLGAWAELHYDHGKQQVYENTPYRGYLSTIQDITHFGLGRIRSVDSVLVKWPNGKMQLLHNVQTDQLLKVNIRDANLDYHFVQETTDSHSLFREITDSVNIH